ncbi:Na(+)/H(+) antiporter NhaD [Desulfosporosinus acididurans]|uniref:Na(+)/H(+) antiporter NhaD n=1 Tax=Desulfosporosinus acididurans TaxID=476652 RepID=A0A0J1FQ29_9FIRM|nr:ArsB/NhaD family transporter [Desulfosporosinus acididurans]KLU65589.1 Na(+)/H(+) antiporter NhaD [Desulfosporosinus acididurans]
MTLAEPLVITLVIFLLTYGLIITETLNRTVVALIGASLILFANVLNQEQAIHAIDFNTIGLLIGMMIIVGITRRTGVFEYTAIKAAKLAKGDPVLILAALSAVTAITSSLLDNVTTVLLIVPVTFSICSELSIDPIPFLISQILASNIGGTATLIGDPPNIMIGSASGLSFLDFAQNLFIPIAATFLITMLILRVIYRKKLTASELARARIMDLPELEAIKDFALLKKSLFVLTLTILGFLLHKVLNFEPATIAIGGATLLLLITKEEPEDIFLTIEWPTLFFFAGLFIIVGALDQVGVIEWVARRSIEATGGVISATTMLILWLSAIASAFIDNIPFVAAMIPLIQKMGQIGGITNLKPLWWALSLGACLGGNGTLIGASANVIVAGLAEKNGVILTYKGFLKIAFPLMILSVIISTVYIFAVYLR